MDTKQSVLSAFAKAQAEFPSIPKNREVMVYSDKGSYAFRYATLDAIVAACRPALNKHGLYLTWRRQTPSAETGTEESIVARIGNDDGYLEASIPILVASDKLTAQKYGSGLTYAKRQSVTMLLGVCADDDEDGNEASETTVASLQSSSSVAEARSSAQTTIAAQAKPQAAPKPDPVRTPQQEQIFQLRAAEAVDELVDAALEGRRSGIEQIWEELGSDNDLKQAVWKGVKARSADVFATVKGILEAKKHASTSTRAEQREAEAADAKQPPEEREPGSDDDLGEEPIEAAQDADASLSAIKAKIAANAKGKRK